MRSSISLLALLALGAACAAPAVLSGEPRFPVPEIPFAPRGYVCYRASGPVAVDGEITPAEWGAVAWTEDFVDIRGGSYPAPALRTRAKLMWDSRYLYIAAELVEPDVWGTLTARDSVIYYDPDFEVFLDPDGDTHDYAELEINALGTEWDLFLTKPYRDDGTALHAWDMPGLKTAVSVQGTLNRYGDTDEGWTVEIAIPWAALGPASGTEEPPAPGDRWRLNFSRVEWKYEVVGTGYRRRLDPASGEPLPEENWVWSPQGLVNLHYPEMWGFLQFSKYVAGTRTEPLVPRESERAAWLLRKVYYLEREHFERTGRYTGRLPGVPRGVRLVATDTMWEAALDLSDGRTMRIGADGRVGLPEDDAR